MSPNEDQEKLADYLAEVSKQRPPWVPFAAGPTITQKEMSGIAFRTEV